MFSRASEGDFTQMGWLLATKRPRRRTDMVDRLLVYLRASVG